MSLHDYADIVSSSVTDFDNNKRRLLLELLNNAEFQSDEKEQNTLSKIKSACLWLDKVIFQFHNPAVRIVTTVRLMGIIGGDLLFRMAGSFPTETDTNKFPAPTYTYPVTLDGVVMDCLDENNSCCFSFDSNFFY